ncbi:EscU/YscU/HrcU family type III secretion system export apparatus switch protein [Neptunicella marina]|uniref:Flagellar biosynthetic protein FlhB n=1 Tax=Neptunicella marina TaxID=2125989 RepID=A0A8J6ISV3_9ALTE|nr:EscU/YscU/HrcU family type III secretion system export apparatus switch protein [Neptunicella marina]MBC3764973.1 EscU/YscU/HrcU family type III secretion system export apparatus switch protein [Neptunicella marina]
MNDSSVKKAIGLKYQNGDVPEVVAKGFGELAEQIIELARESGVLVHEDQDLSDFLARLDLGQHIPAELYHVIAELIAFSYVLQGKFPEGWAIPAGYLNTQA